MKILTSVSLFPFMEKTLCFRTHGLLVLKRNSLRLSKLTDFHVVKQKILNAFDSKYSNYNNIYKNFINF